MKIPLNEREFELVNIIGAKLGSNQRDISRHMRMSLGMTNILLRRLITKGYIRITQLNKKKFQYILTSKGFAEKMRKSVKYALKTIDSIGLVKRSLTSLFQSSFCQGARKFYVLGGADLAGLIEITVQEHFGIPIECIRIENLHLFMSDGIVLICREHISLKGFEFLRVVNIVEILAHDQDMLEQTDALVAKEKSLK